MNYRLIITSGAAEDTVAAYIWYEQQLSGLGESFLAELDDCYSFLKSNPAAAQTRYETYKMLPMRRFPFVVVYELKGSEIIVYSVFHTHREPKKSF